MGRFLGRGKFAWSQSPGILVPWSTLAPYKYGKYGTLPQRTCHMPRLHSYCPIVPVSLNWEISNIG